MRCIGIIAEYNPFHTGHAYHIKRAKEEIGADAVAVLMSGCFVQRGEPAVYDKWARAAHALQNGADLVLELPAVYALSSAQDFARGAVATLEATGVVDFLSFGSEAGELAPLQKIAAIMETPPPTFQEELTKRLRAGNSYDAAVKAALGQTDAALTQLLQGSNNILAIEYLRACRTMRPHTIARVGSVHNETTGNDEFVSAAYLRSCMARSIPVDDYLPYEHDAHFQALYAYTQLILYALETCTACPPSVQPALYARLMRAERKSISTIIESTVARQFSESAVKRAICNILIRNTEKSSVAPSYIRVLGLNMRGAEVLNEMKQKAALPVIVKPAAYREKDGIWETESRAVAVWDYCAAHRNLTQSPVVLA